MCVYVFMLQALNIEKVSRQLMILANHCIPLVTNSRQTSNDSLALLQLFRVDRLPVGFVKNKNADNSY